MSQCFLCRQLHSSSVIETLFVETAQSITFLSRPSILRVGSWSWELGIGCGELRFELRVVSYVVASYEL